MNQSSNHPNSKDEGGSTNSDEMAAFDHQPVMIDEILEVFAPISGGLFVDATLGGGGHAAAMLDAHPDVALLGLDQDLDAIAAATGSLGHFGDRVEIVRTRFDRLAEVLDGRTPVAVLFDLGVSSPQLDRSERGFSFRQDAPLDMRMDRQQALSAYDVVNSYEVADLARVLADYGDERFARRVAERIVAARPIDGTVRLAEIVQEAIPAATRRTGGHPARRTFQALRIEVNDELGALERALDQAVDALAPGGRLAVLSYHSGEDRIVKRRFRAATSTQQPIPRGLPVEPQPEPMRLIHRGGRTASEEEATANPRSTSARLRVLEHLEEAA